MPVDVGSIVPSSRDLFQCVSRRRRGLALVARVDAEPVAEQVHRLDEAGIVALAWRAADETMRAGAAATRSVPSLCLAPAHDRDAILAARWFGADGVCLGPGLAGPGLDELAAHVRSTRMLPLGVAETAAEAQLLAASGLRAFVVHGRSAEEVVGWAAAFPKSALLVADVAVLDEGGLRALVGHVDAAVVPPLLHQRACELCTELDP